VFVLPSPPLLLLLLRLLLLLLLVVHADPRSAVAVAKEVTTRTTAARRSATPASCSDMSGASAAKRVPAAEVLTTGEPAWAGRSADTSAEGACLATWQGRCV